MKESITDLSDIRGARATTVFLLLAALPIALVLAIPSADSQINDAKAIVVDMSEVEPFQLDDGCINAGGKLMPPGCTFNAEDAIILRGIITDTVRLQYMEMPAGTSSPDHNHPDEEVFYLLTGSIKVTGGDSTFTLEPGDVFVVPAYLPHEFEALVDSTFIEVGGPGPLLSMPGLKKVGGSIGINAKDSGSQP
ncbi:MAG: cupin domain-containing protein [Pseudomonadota bacterium]